LVSVADPEWDRGGVRPPKNKGEKKRERERQTDRQREREREREGGGPPSLYHSPVKCNKSLYIFTRCIAL
jgi:hypothetical protein